MCDETSNRDRQLYKESVYKNKESKKTKNILHVKRVKRVKNLFLTAQITHSEVQFYTCFYEWHVPFTQMKFPYEFFMSKKLQGLWCSALFLRRLLDFLVKIPNSKVSKFL